MLMSECFDLKILDYTRVLEPKLTLQIDEIDSNAKFRLYSYLVQSWFWLLNLLLFTNFPVTLYYYGYKSALVQLSLELKLV